jgi:ribosomal protein L24E
MICPHCGKETDGKKDKSAFVEIVVLKDGKTLRFASKADAKEYKRRAKL